MNIFCEAFRVTPANYGLHLTLNTEKRNSLNNIFKYKNIGVLEMQMQVIVQFIRYSSVACVRGDDWQPAGLDAVSSNLELHCPLSAFSFLACRLDCPFSTSALFLIFSMISVTIFLHVAYLPVWPRYRHLDCSYLLKSISLQYMVIE